MQSVRDLATRSELSLAACLLRFFVLTKPNKPRMTEMVVGCPLDKLECPTRTGFTHRHSSILVEIRPWPTGRFALPADSQTDTWAFQACGDVRTVAGESAV